MSVSAALPRVPDQLPLGRDSVSWKVNVEPIVFAGGGRALLMQVAHPGVGAGVEQHSTYARDPWGRLFRTIDIMTKLSYGSAAESARQQRILEKMHRRVKGTTDRGDVYSAFDADLQVWVWATLVDTALLMYEQVLPPLTPAEREQFYEESKLVAYGCGVPRGGCPDTWADFATYVDHVVEHDLRVTDSARQVAVAAMVPPLPFGLAELAGRPNKLVTVGHLAPSLRAQYGFEWNAAMATSLRRWTAAAKATSVLPTPVRQAGAKLNLSRKKPLRVPWLQKQGAALTERRLSDAGFGS